MHIAHCPLHLTHNCSSASPLSRRIELQCYMVLNSAVEACHSHQKNSHPQSLILLFSSSQSASFASFPFLSFPFLSSCTCDAQPTLNLTSYSCPLISQEQPKCHCRCREIQLQVTIRNATANAKRVENRPKLHGSSPFHPFSQFYCEDRYFKCKCKCKCYNENKINK